MSLSSKFTNNSSKQVMESYYSCNQGYAPWNPTPYQPHDLGYDAYQSYGFGDAYYGYEDPSPLYPPSQKGIEEVIQLLCQERKEIREILEQIANQVDTLCSIVIQWKTQSAINNSSSTSQPLNSEDRPSKSLPNPRGCIPTLSRCKGRKGTLSQPRGTCRWRHPQGGRALRDALKRYSDRAAGRILCRQLKYATGYCKWQSGLAATIH
ncbi:hypothetical protein PIB30_070841 [Stylosanthes scabra]|uniref:Uncharacterized protein n=1 Tax=Stylosanthes scabra TaxID=79078 RepID=A0ABU6QNK6_9FABA|nr:hypothetical protein [Stylosanthes scabra]